HRTRRRRQGHPLRHGRAGLRRHRLRVGDGGRIALRETPGRPVHRTIARRAHHRPAGTHTDPTAHPGDELRPRRPQHGPRPVLDPPGHARAHRERAAEPAAGLSRPSAQTKRRAAEAARALHVPGSYTYRGLPAYQPKASWATTTPITIVIGTVQSPVTSRRN